ncbi:MULTISPECIES: acyltransferase family protein [Pseudomonas]|uniref:acyltransferase family protein n=1 Tax=Pseudomonas TaxID=286 RepID=UPI00209DD645|nr:acyltransferase [Pseudomonas koreensis]MCP1477245.1 peptidoglycan/LPS O-acetylase OafA/YrhL [Pseudomonas koreensis]
MKNTNKLDALTFLRFVAASLVVVFHYGATTVFYSALPFTLKIGPLMVTFFFVLSGFVISISHYKKKIEFGRFYLNRISRIFPAYFVSLLIFVAYSPAPTDMYDAVLALTMLQAWVPSYALIGNSPAWSISVEIFFYLVAPALILLSNKGEKSSAKLWIGFAVAVWAISQAVLMVMASPPFYTGYPSASHDLVFYFPLSHFCSFLLGFAGGIAYKNGFLRNQISDFVAISLLIATLLLINEVRIYGKVINDLFGYHVPYTSSFYSLLFLPAVYFCGLADNTLRRVIGSPALVLLGEASYALYIFQTPVHLGFESIVPSDMFTSPNIRFAVYFFMLALISIVVYKFVEAPIINFVKQKYKASYSASSLRLDSHTR